MRAIHRRICLLLAAGHSITRVAEITGSSYNRVWMLSQDPAAKNYIATLEEQIEARGVDQIAEAHAKVAGVNSMSWQIIYDRLERAIDEETEDDIPWAVLLKAAGDSADRVGLAKRSVALNVNVDFASQLQKAVQRSRMKIIEGTPAAPASPPTPLGDALVEGRAPQGSSPRPVLVHEAPLMKPGAGEPKPPSAHPPLSVSRRRA